MAFSEPLVQWASESSVFLVACSLSKLERTERTSVLYRLSRKWAEEFHPKYLFFYRTGKPEPTLVPQIKKLVSDEWTPCFSHPAIYRSFEWFPDLLNWFCKPDFSVNRPGHEGNITERFHGKWFESRGIRPLNRRKQLPAPYKRLIHDFKRNRQTNNRWIENNSKTTTDQSLQLSRFDDQSHHDKTDQSKPRPEA